MENRIKTRIILRHDSTSGWQSVGDSFVLYEGEIGIEFATGAKSAKIKIGDGVNAWAKLPYYTPDVDITLPSSYTWGDLFGSGTDLENPAAQTKNLDLKKPTYLEKANIGDLNKNYDKIDEAFGELDELVTLLQERMTSFITFPEPAQGTTQAEVNDVRIRADGTSYESAGDAVRAIDSELSELKDKVGEGLSGTIPNGLYYKDNQLYLTSDDNLIGDPVIITGGGGGGSGGGGGGYTYNVSLLNKSGTRLFSVAKGAPVVLKFEYTSLDSEGYGDGDGVGILYNNGIQQTSFIVRQGLYELDVTAYLKEGGNNLKIQVTNTEGTSQSLTYTVNVLVLSLTTNSPLMASYNVDSYGFQYTVNGAGEKVVHFIFNEKEETRIIEDSGVSRQYNITRPKKDGAYIFEMYVTVGTGDDIIYSDRIRAGMIWYSNTTTDPIILINSNLDKITQGDPITLPFMVFHPSYDTVKITQTILNEDGTVFNEITPEVGRNSIVWSIQDYPIGKTTFRITCEDISAEKVIEVEASTFDREIYTDNLLFEFNAKDRQNIEVNPEHWNYGDIEASFENVGWGSIDGWLADKDGQGILRLLPRSKMIIPYKPFAKNIISTGYTIEVEIATHNVADYDSIIVDVFKDGKGLLIKSQSATLSSAQNSIMAQFKEDEKIRITFVVEQNKLDSSGENMTGGLIYIYINGILCGVQSYPGNDDFAQIDPVGLTIGAESCGIDVYFIRFYNIAFTAEMQLNNFIVDRPSLKERIDTDLRNDILNTSASDDPQTKITINSLKGANNYIVMQCSELPQFKGDKKKDVSMYFVDTKNPERNFSAPGCQFDVQGTSSQAYPIKNYKIAFKNGIVYTQSGETANGFKFTKNSLESETFCLKADFASSENANNVRLVELYEQTTPYKTPPQQVVSDGSIRQGIYGEPIVVFWENTDTKEIKFIGKYNMNDDKSNENVFGFVDTDISSVIPQDKQRIECWEWRNNNTAFCLFQEDSGWNETVTDEDGEKVPAWRASFEPRFPDTDPEYNKTDALYRIISWVVSTRTDRATNAPLAKEKYYLTRDVSWTRGKEYYINNEGILADITEKGDIISYDNDVSINPKDFYGKMGASTHSELEGKYAFYLSQETNLWSLYKEEEKIEDNIDQIGLYGVSISDSTITSFAFEYKIVGEGWSPELYEKFTNDTAEYRLSKFKDEFSQYFILDAMAFYYLFTEVFLMIDSRSKNMFLTTFDGEHWFPIPYDMDTAIGINNSGQLVFDYNLEDTDYASGAMMYDGKNKLYDGSKLYTGKLVGEIFEADTGEKIPFSSSKVYNGQESVLWINFRECFSSTVKKTYEDLRSSKNIFNSTSITEMFNNYQAAWAEVIWNIDQSIKYLPYPEYLPMAQGNKKSQRDFWLFNSFKYRDSKYQTADAKENFILLRLYNKGEINIVPYSHIYARVQFGNAKDETKRAWRNEKVLFTTDGISVVNDLETHIYSADRISDLGDLSDFKVGLCNFSHASKLSRIILGREEEGYTNGNLKSLELGKNGLLNEINVSNCYNLAGSLDAGGCYGLEIFKARGSRVSGVTFSNGGRLKEVALPETIVNLTLRNQTEIQSLTLDSYENLETLFLENVPTLPIENIILSSPKLNRVRLSNLEWTASSEQSLREVINKLKTCRGLTETGADTDKATVTARVKVDSIDDDFLKEINDTFPGLVVIVNGVAKYYVKYININREELYYYIADAGSDAIDPVATGALDSAPTYPDTEDTRYEYIGWQNLPTNISQSYTIVAKYKETYRVRFYNSETAIEPVYEEWVEKFNAATDPVAAKLIDPPMKATTAQYHYTFKDWGVDLTSIEEPLELYPTFNEIINTYMVKIFGGQKQLGEDQILEYGAAITLPTENVYNYYWDEDTEQYEYFTIYEHYGWDINEDGIDDGKELIVMPQQYTTNPIVVNALFSAANNVINDSWEEIIEACENGTYKKDYLLGMQKEIEFTYEGKVYSAMFEIVDYDYDKITGEDNKHASLTFMICNPVFATSIRNQSSFTWVAPTGETITANLAGGFSNTPLFNALNNIVYSDSTLQANVKMVDKMHDQGPLQETKEDYYAPKIVSVKTWTPSATELGVVPSSMIGEGATEATKIALAQGGDGTKSAYVWFTNNASRRKTFNEKFERYWTRTYGASDYRMLGVGENGGIAETENKIGILMFNDQGIVFGFCV